MTASRLNRRQLLQLIAAGAAASVAGCSRPDEAIFPLADQPDGIAPGAVTRYATTVPFAGHGRGVTGFVVEGRPIKLEGLAAHPASLGSTDLFAETAILDLYDPQRLKAASGPGGPASWPALGRVLLEHLARARASGRRVAVLTGRTTSPTLLRRLASVQADVLGLTHVAWDPFEVAPPLAPRLAAADVLVTLDADPLGPGPNQIANARAWATRRRQEGRPFRHYAMEPTMTQTGQLADVRATATPAEVATVRRLLAGWSQGAPATFSTDDGGESISALVARWLARLRRDHAAGTRIELVTAADVWRLADPQPLTALVAAIHAGQVEVLVTVDCNPVYTAPPELSFAAAMERVPLTVAASIFPDETSAAAQWRTPLSHALESWGDWLSPDGTASIGQPLVRPLYDSRSAIELVDLLADAAGGPGGQARVRESWASLDDAGWRRALASGIAAQPSAAPLPPLTLQEAPAATGGFVLDIRPSPTLWDGRYSTNAWAQECPDPLTKEVWGASARIAAADMARLGLSDGDHVRIARGIYQVELPARAVAGQAAGVVTLLAGYGRQGTGAVADGIGANAFLLTGQGAVRVTKGEGRTVVPSTQHQFDLDGELARLFPVLAPGETMPPPPAQPTLLPPNPPARDNAPPQWAMAIDTDVCIGCNACVVACQAENNQPVIGPEQVAVGRDMHWLRIDRYEHPDGAGGFQPVPCMQCEAAPCEPVCPVEASVHDAQGLNVQVYNRCIGTRTCQANCPYKVRRFNFLDYAGSSVWGDAEDASITAQRNPDVTVRARGVMEKCTYCVQRITREVREADAHGRPVGEVVTACQSACPTRAITFGKLGEGTIAAARADPRHYALLGELGTRPRTTYLATRRNLPGGDG